MPALVILAAVTGSTITNTCYHRFVIDFEEGLQVRGDNEEWDLQLFKMLAQSVPKVVADLNALCSIP